MYLFLNMPKVLGMRTRIFGSFLGLLFLTNASNVRAEEKLRYLDITCNIEAQEFIYLPVEKSIYEFETSENARDVDFYKRNRKFGVYVNGEFIDAAKIEYSCHINGVLIETYAHPLTRDIFICGNEIPGPYLSTYRHSNGKVYTDGVCLINTPFKVLVKKEDHLLAEIDGVYYPDSLLASVKFKTQSLEICLKKHTATRKLDSLCKAVSSEQLLTHPLIMKPQVHSSDNLSKSK